MKKNTFYKVSGYLFLIVGLLHFVRAINGWSLAIDVYEIPVWMSWIAVILVWYLGIRALDFAKGGK